jgi:hypothetical protein
MARAANLLLLALCAYFSALLADATVALQLWRDMPPP